MAIIKSRLCRLVAAKVGVPVGHGYNYFLACDTAERIIFAVVAGSGSGKLCWHSRRNDNDQKNAGYVRESAGGSEQALRAEEVQKRSFCRRSFPHFFRCWKKWGRRRQILRLRRCAATPHLPRLRRATCLPAGRSVRGSDRPPACHSTPRTPQGGGLRGASFNTADPSRGRLGGAAVGAKNACRGWASGRVSLRAGERTRSPFDRQR